ncbi:nuclear transport factor 2 family protein [Xenophilus azovorans]|uniref:nuclear transport factor 2 family protein n=1 Tax=Xenophilus azovorans TaxID=151755 RepID=UPI00056FAC77|nr:nuclear transport factor 2 family protein [Xenophilus azovorans]
MHNWGIPERGDAAADAAIREVVIGYCRCVDTFDDDVLLELFAQQGEWHRPGQAPLKGRAEIAGFLRGRDRTVTMRHIASNIIVDVQGADRARAISYWTVLKAVAGAPEGQALLPFAMGEYHDDFLLEQGRWRIARRETKYVFR